MNPNPVPQPVSAYDYLMKFREQRQQQAQALAQMLPPIGAQGASLPPYAFGQTPVPPAPTAPQSMVAPPRPFVENVPPITQSRNVGPAPGMSMPNEPPVALPPTGAAPLPPRRDQLVSGYDPNMPSFGTAQEYADKFAGGDLSKVRSRGINIDGVMHNDFFTKGLFDAFGSGNGAASLAPTPGTEDPNFLQRFFGLFSLPSLGG